MSLKTKLLKAGVFVCSAALPILATSDDTDIYINNSNANPDALPQLMFYLDYRPNVLASSLCSNASLSSCTQAEFFRQGDQYDLSADVAALGTGPFKFFDLLRLALKSVLRLEEFDQKIKVGFMLSHNQASQGQTVLSDGGAILQGFRTINASQLPDGASGISDIITKLQSLAPLESDQDHPNQGPEVFFEFYRYLRGGYVSKGHLGFRDFEKNGVATPQNMDVYAPASWDPAIETVDANGEPRYVSPLVDSDCSKVFTATFAFGDSQDNGSNDLINAPIASGGMSKAGETVVNNSNSWRQTIGYLFGNDIGAPPYTATDVSGKQNVTSYFFYKGNQGNQFNALAQAGGTQRAYDLGSDDPGVIVAALVQVLREVLSTSTTFVAASIPVNVFNRAEAINSVYVAIFEANFDSRPSWPGNIKKLKIGTVAGTPALIDVTGGAAVGNDGRISAAAKTFWTTGSDATVLPADPNNPPDNDAGVDGKNVLLGGAGQKIPGFLNNAIGSSNSAAGARQVYYWDQVSPAAGGTRSLTPLNVDNATRDALKPLLLPAGTNTEVENLLRYIRGLNDAGTAVRTVQDSTPTGTRTLSWITGDPLHSRPRPINYGAFGGHTTTNPAIYVAYGSNDGFMRLIENTNSSGVETGRELWAFMPPEAMASPRAGVERTQQILKTNQVMNDPRDAASATPRPYHPATVDGPPVELVIDGNGDGTVNGSDKVFLFFGLRRGGRAYYGMDITNPNEPKIKWRISSADADFAELGYTFGTPKLGRVNVDGVSTRALFFSGGYDENKDFYGYGSSDGYGKAMFVVNADTGTLIWKAVGGATYGTSGDGRVFTHPALTDSIPSGLTVADTDGDGFIDRMLVGDSGGNVWRADLTTGARTQWKLTLMAKLGRHGAAGATNDRRFFHEPDLVQTKNESGPYDAILIGSGNRENPLDKPSANPVVENRFYMVRDTATGVGAAQDSYAAAAVTDLADPDSSSPFADVTQFNCDTTGAATQPACIAAQSGPGWKLRLASGTGEKSLASPLTISGTVFFTSYIPTPTDSTSCAPSEGLGYLYSVSIGTGSTRLNNFDPDGDGVPNDPPANREEGGTELRSPGIPAEVVYVPGSGVLCPDLTFCSDSSLPRIRSHWLRRND